jgi:DNA-binding GntR family transcriptional regulator
MALIFHRNVKSPSVTPTGGAGMPPANTSEAPEPVDRATAVYLQLRELIVRGQLGPGARIIETEVAGRLGVSRTPVRSAIQRLEQEGFVSANRGEKQGRPVVAPLTREDAAELFQLVGALEGMAAARAARLPSERRRDILAGLREQNELLGELAEHPRPDRDRFFELDSRFHWTFVEAAAGARLANLHKVVKPQAERYIRLYVSLLGDSIRTSVEEHHAIIQAMASGATNQAQRSVEANWTNASQRLQGVMDQVGERGSW